MSDLVTDAIASLDFWPVTEAALFLHVWTYAVFALIAVGLYVFLPRVRKHKLKIACFLLALVLTAVLTVWLKSVFHLQRPCNESLKLPECPYTYQNDFSFPSGHTSYSFVFLGASVGTSTFPLFMLLSFAVAFSRIYLGIHTLDDVTGGMAIGLASYFVIQNFMREAFPEWIPERERFIAPPRITHPRFSFSMLFFEVRRQLAHILFGVGLIVLILLIGEPLAQLAMMLLLALSLIAMHVKLELYRFGWLDTILNWLERPKVIPVKGAAMYVLGSLVAVSFLPDPNKAMAAIGILALGDGAATLFGAFGRTTLPWNRNKTTWGAFSFAVFATLAAFPFVGLAALPAALIAALFESMPLEIDDNLLVPAVATAFFLIF